MHSDAICVSSTCPRVIECDLVFGFVVVIQALESLVNRKDDYRGESAVNNETALTPFILTGPMGAGKSEVLKRLVAEQSHSLYVAARVNTASHKAASLDSLHEDPMFARTPNQLKSCVDAFASAFGIRRSRSIFHRALCFFQPDACVWHS